MGDHPAHRARREVDADPAAAAPEDTIAALATPPGRGGVGIVRVSGGLARAVARAVLGRVPEARRAHRAAFRDAGGEPIDWGLALFFPAPRSFTGEDVLELHGHGGPVVMDLLLERVLALGARAARPGEFSQRAFLNDKLDLAQAEAIADLIDSATAEAARGAQRSLQGAFSERVHALMEGVVELRTYVEAAIDFPDEEVDFLSDARLAERLRGLLESLEGALQAARQGVLLKEGATVVIAGSPNVGKSSLLNRLADRDSAIVTDVPGTTRDLLREHIQLDGLPLHVVDTAGLRVTADVVEREGVARAWKAVGDADGVLLVVEDRTGVGGEEMAMLERVPAARPVLVVRNKIDLSGAEPGASAGPHGAEVRASALTGAGVAALAEEVKRLVGYRGAEGAIVARRRHLQSLERARSALGGAAGQLAGPQAGELVAEELREAQRALGEITGEVTSEDLLDRIFSSFCIGK